MKNKSGTMFIIAAPSGAGKTALIKSLLLEIDNIDVSISYTTRTPRAAEKDGEAYYFIDEAEFKSLIKQNFFLEYAKVYNNYYGTPKAWVEQAMLSGRGFILEIDWQGARQVKAQLPNSVGIFILPPDYQTLRSRLIARQNDALEIIERRMDAARGEIFHYKDFDYVVINDDFDQALAEIKAIITATYLGRYRQSAFYDNFVNQMMAQAR